MQGGSNHKKPGGSITRNRALNRETLKDVPGAAGDVYTKYDVQIVPIVGAGPCHAGHRPDTNYISYSFDALNRTTQVRENSTTADVGVLQTYFWDALSRRSPITPMSRANGTYTGYAYDTASRLTGLSHDLADTSQDFALGFAYTLASQLQTRTTSNTAFGWWSAPEQAKSYVANGLNQYTSVSGVTFLNDPNGNLQSDGSRTFAYDSENRLTSVTGSASMTLSYDPLGRLASTTSAGVTTSYLYDGDRLVAEYNGSGPVLRRYAHGPGVDEPIVWYEGSGLTTKRWLHQDERGSVIAYSDASGVASGYNYGPYGEQPSWTGSRFRYTGQIMLPEVQLYHYKARVYDPKIGRFLQTDPIGYDDDLNLYAYVRNDPLNRTDPDGLSGCKSGDKEFTTCTIKIEYDKKTSKGTLTVTGENKGDKNPTTLLTSKVVVGGDGHVTPTGTFTASYWEKDHVSTKYGSWADTPYSKTKLGGNAFGPYQLHIKELEKRGIWIHGTMGPSWNRSTIVNNLVSPTSHGCVRMCNADNIALHEMMPNPAGNKINISTNQDEE